MKKILSNLIFFICITRVVTECRKENLTEIQANDSLSVGGKCGQNKTCVRFCCNDLGTSGVDGNFSNLFSKKGAKNLDRNIDKILFGYPKCDKDEKLYKLIRDWELLKNGTAEKNTLIGKNIVMSHDRYCLDLSEKLPQFIYCFKISFSEKYHSICNWYLFFDRDKNK